MCSLTNLIGIPFVDRGRTPSGCDCMGLSIMAHKTFDVDIPDFNVDSNSSEEINNTFLGQLENSKWKQLAGPEVPCLVLFGFDQYDPKMVTHVGTYIGSGKILHTLTDKSSSVIRMDHPFFKNKIIGFYKYA